MSFKGFTMPQGTFFPPEFRDLLPHLDTMSELKVLLCVLDAYFQAGLDARPLTMDQIQERTGLSRYGVNEGLKRGRARGTVRRLSVGKTFAYEPSLKIRLPCMHESYSKRSDSTPKEDEKHAWESDLRKSDPRESDLRKQILQVLVRDFGVSTRVADDIACHRPDAEAIWQQIEYARYEIGAGFTPTNSAGYIVARIRDDRPAPLGYGKEETKQKRWYTDEEFETYFVKPKEGGAHE